MVAFDATWSSLTHPTLFPTGLAGTARGLLSGGGLGVSPAAVELSFEIESDFPLVTLVSMIAPSPDWFVGVAGLPLRVEGEWLSVLTVELRHEAVTHGPAACQRPGIQRLPRRA